MKPKIDFAVGGQAVLEGVMMRSPRFYTVCVRSPKGELEFFKAPFLSFGDRYPILKWPLIRGFSHLIEALTIGSRALDYSNRIFLQEEGEEEPTGWFHTILSTVSILFSILFALFLLKFIPLFVATQVSLWFPFFKEHYFFFNAVDGASKILVFLTYISLISYFQDIRRVFAYHGAEHKSIWTYERNLPLTVENARKQSRFHPRCGTSFIFVVALMSILVYTLMPPQDSFLMQLLSRIALLPLISGIGYEFLKFSAKFQDHAFVKALSFPGLLLQRLTTAEPDDQQLEVALSALEASLQAESS